MKEPQENKKNPDDFGLSEEELSKIFLGTETESESVVEPVKEVDAQLVEKKKRGRPRKEKVEDPNKRPWGRPKKWTDDKIEQLKFEKKALAQKRREDLKTETSLAKVATNIPNTYYDRQRILDQTIKTKEEVENHFSKNRTIIKDAIEQQANSLLYNKNPCKKHMFKIDYFDNGEAVTSCISCSCMKRMTMTEWDKINN